MVPTDLIVGKVERDHCAARTPVILDSELAALYGVTVSVFNQAPFFASPMEMPTITMCPPRVLLHLTPASAGIEPLARHLSGGNYGGTFLPTFSQTS